MNTHHTSSRMALLAGLVGVCGLAATGAVADGTYMEPSKMPLSKWIDVWLKEYTGNVKEHTLVTYETQCRVHIKPALGAVALFNLRPHEIQAFYRPST